jgi:hypothetical protein
VSAFHLNVERKPVLAAIAAFRSLLEQSSRITRSREMPVVSREVKPEGAGARSQARRQAVDLSGLALGSVGTCFSLGLWIVGARYTVDGVLVIINRLLTFLTIPVQIPIPPGWLLYVLLVPIPLMFSLIEWRKVPLELTDEGWRFAAGGQWVVWLLVYGMDAVTTWNGLGVIDPNSPVIIQQIATTPWAQSIVTAVLTIGPEALLWSMVGVFRGAIGRRS